MELEFATLGEVNLDILNNDGESVLDLAFSTGLDHLIEAIRVHQKRSKVSSITLLLKTHAFGITTTTYVTAIYEYYLNVALNNGAVEEQHMTS